MPIHTMQDLLDEYVEVYGRAHWSHSTYERTLRIIETLARISKRSLNKLPTQNIIFAFPPIQFAERTLTVLKKPKTKSSIRTVFIPQALLVQLRAFQEAQIQHIQTSGAQYRNYNLIFCNRSGTPLRDNLLSNQLLAVAQQANPSPVTFHSLRHSSITYKLLLSGGDIKSVQGDSGHSQSKMVTDVYAHILDKQRKTIAETFNQTFYQNHTEKDFSQFVQLLTEYPSYKEKLLKLLSEIPNA